MCEQHADSEPRKKRNMDSKKSIHDFKSSSLWSCVNSKAKRSDPKKTQPIFVGLVWTLAWFGSWSLDSKKSTLGFIWDRGKFKFYSFYRSCVNATMVWLFFSPIFGRDRSCVNPTLEHNHKGTDFGQKLGLELQSRKHTYVSIHRTN